MNPDRWCTNKVFEPKKIILKTQYVQVLQCHVELIISATEYFHVIETVVFILTRVDDRQCFV